MTTDDREPLWRVMFDAGAKVTAQGAHRTTPEAKAAEIRALRDWLVPEEAEGPRRRQDQPFTNFACEMAEWRQRQRLRAQLTAEAERAEKGEP